MAADHNTLRRCPRRQKELSGHAKDFDIDRWVLEDSRQRVKYNTESMGSLDGKADVPHRRRARCELGGEPWSLCL